MYKVDGERYTSWYKSGDANVVVNKLAVAEPSGAVPLVTAVILVLIHNEFENVCGTDNQFVEVVPIVSTKFPANGLNTYINLGAVPLKTVPSDVILFLTFVLIVHVLPELTGTLTIEDVSFCTVTPVLNALGVIRKDLLDMLNIVVSVLKTPAEYQALFDPVTPL